MKKILVIGAVLFFSVVSLFANGGGEASKSEGKSMAGKDITFPLAESVEISAAYGYRPAIAPYDELEYFNIIEEMSNVKIDFIPWDVTSVNEKKQISFASGDMPNMMLSIANTNDLVIYGEQGLILPIDGMLDEYAPNLSDNFAKRPDIKRAVTMPDGHIYGLPMIKEQPITSSCTFMVNEGWLNQLGKDKPVTLDEFTEVLRLIKKNDMNGNGDTTDEIPWSFTWAGWRIGQSFWNPVLGAFGIPLIDHYIVEDDKVLYAPATDNYKEAIKYLAMLYSEGLIDQEFSTMMDQAPFNAKCQAQPPRIGFTQTWSTQNFNVGYEEPVYVPMTPLEGPNGDRTWGRRIINPMPSATIITNTCDYPEIAVKWADLSQEQDMALQAQYGLFGEWMEKQADGTIKQIPTSAGKMPVEVDFGTSVPSQWSGLVLKSSRDRIQVDPGNIKVAQDVPVFEPYLVDASLYFPGTAVMTSAEIDELVIYQTDVESFVDQTMIGFIIKNNVDEGWDEYIATLEKMGLDKMLDVKQGVYNRYMGLK